VFLSRNLLELVAEGVTGGIKDTRNVSYPNISVNLNASVTFPSVCRSGVSVDRGSMLFRSSCVAQGTAGTFNQVLGNPSKPVSILLTHRVYRFDTNIFSLNFALTGFKKITQLYLTVRYCFCPSNRLWRNLGILLTLLREDCWLANRIPPRSS